MHHSVSDMHIMPSTYHLHPLRFRAFQPIWSARHLKVAYNNLDAYSGYLSASSRPYEEQFCSLHFYTRNSRSIGIGALMNAAPCFAARRYLDETSSERCVNWHAITKSLLQAGSTVVVCQDGPLHLLKMGCSDGFSAVLRRRDCRLDTACGDVRETCR